jgi:hypothetical protein
MIFKAFLTMIRELPNFFIGQLEGIAKRLQAQSMLGREYWYVTDQWEKFFAIPVYVIDVDKRGVIKAIWELDDDLQTWPSFFIDDPAKLFKTRLEAEKIAIRKNFYNDFVKARRVDDA